MLALAPSPRRDGNSEILLKEFCRGVEEEGWQVDFLRVNDLKFRPCQACDACAKDGRCVVRDDMQDVYQKLIDADALVVASPVTFGSLNAQVKMLIDRFQCWWHAKYNLNVPFVPDEPRRQGFFICVGALKRKRYCENATEIIKVFFHNINHNFAGSLAYRGFDQKGAIREAPEALDEVYRAGKEFATGIDGGGS